VRIEHGRIAEAVRLFGERDREKAARSVPPDLLGPFSASARKVTPSGTIRSG